MCQVSSKNRENSLLKGKRRDLEIKQTEGFVEDENEKVGVN